jgi:hypothetical protein
MSSTFGAYPPKTFLPAADADPAAHQPAPQQTRSTQTLKRVSRAQENRNHHLFEGFLAIKTPFSAEASRLRPTGLRSIRPIAGPGYQGQFPPNWFVPSTRDRVMAGTGLSRTGLSRVHCIPLPMILIDRYKYIHGYRDYEVSSPSQTFTSLTLVLLARRSLWLVHFRAGEYGRLIIEDIICSYNK